MNETSQEKRRRTRIFVEMYVTVSVDAEREFKSLKTVNISLNGVLLRGDRKPAYWNALLPEDIPSAVRYEHIWDILLG